MLNGYRFTAGSRYGAPQSGLTGRGPLGSARVPPSADGSSRAGRPALPRSTGCGHTVVPEWPRSYHGPLGSRLYGRTARNDAVALVAHSAPARTARLRRCHHFCQHPLLRLAQPPPAASLRLHHTPRHRHPVPALDLSPVLELLPAPPRRGLAASLR
ncbi:hypothetical protein DB31_5060 [Hyalangium minutum]|uniref:Uncharacterized protein n=1 Tax=Hyalangium minutum TaxID=394096 RepID=A0A085WQQ5_9BACT|nr:hypothetical protein DB31_5060 [Hyalangium minutum]